MDKKRILLISTAVLAGSMIFTGYQMKIPYKEQIPNQQGLTNTISVAGEGKYSVSPDTLLININVSETGKVTKDAQDKANTKIARIQDILKSFSIPKEKIQTTNVSVYPEYDWSSSQRKLLRYRSQQSVNVKVQGDNFANKGSDIISKLSEIGEINIDNTQFIIDNKDLANEKAREKAFEDAKNKAEQLAKLGGVSLGRPTMITDQDIQYNYPIPMYAEAKNTAMGAGQASSADTLSPGQTDITARIQVTYEIK